MKKKTLCLRVNDDGFASIYGMSVLLMFLIILSVLTMQIKTYTHIRRQEDLLDVAILHRIHVEAEQQGKHSNDETKEKEEAFIKSEDALYDAKMDVDAKQEGANDTIREEEFNYRQCTISLSWSSDQVVARSPCMPANMIVTLEEDGSILSYAYSA